MSLSTPDLSVEIAVSNMDLYPYDLPGRATWQSNLEQLVPFLEQTGCRNFELVPTEAVVADIDRRTLSGDTEIIDAVVGSLHESFLNGVGPIGRIGDRRGVHRAKTSVYGMDFIAKALTHKVPGVRYPEMGMAAPDDTTYAVMQPCAEVDQEFCVQNQADRLRKMARLGILGLCPDTVHDRRKDADGTAAPYSPDNWVGRFASGRTFQMHVGADRFDMKGRDPEIAARSVAEFKAFTARKWQKAYRTEMGEMIVAAVESWVPPAELAAAAGKPVLRQVLEIAPRPTAAPRRVRQHARFVENLAEIIRHTGATPLLWDK